MTINSLSHFKFQNLEVLNLSRNNLSSLDFMSQLFYPNLKEIWLNDNKIKEILPLIKFKNLENIQLKNNQIDNINNLNAFLSEFEFLKTINMKFNNINLNDEKNFNELELIKTKNEKINIIL